MKRGGGDEMEDTTTHNHIKIILRKFECGEVQYPDGTRVPVKGDVSKISRILVFSPEEKALISIFQFMSASLTGTRQMRRRIVPASMRLGGRFAVVVDVNDLQRQLINGENILYCMHI